MKSRVRFLAVLASLSFVSLSIHAQAHDGHLPQSDGVIKKIDAAAGKVSIAHGEIANLKMPPMTMTFKAKNPEVLKGWKEGDKVRFRAAEVKGDLTVVSIEAAK
ncbi:MAG: copper-binding protein [Rhodocyclales bacterium]|nr:copper-binding protein [Rhodocyclales bacterium]